MQCLVDNFIPVFVNSLSFATEKTVKKDKQEEKIMAEKARLEELLKSEKTLDECSVCGSRANIYHVNYGKQICRKCMLEMPQEKRVKEIAAPMNCARLGRNTPCTKSGSCMDCKSEGSICADRVVMARQMTKGRVKVILVAEELGY